MSSFYSLPSTIMHHPNHHTLRAAYSFYNVSKITPLVDLIQDTLIVAKNVSRCCGVCGASFLFFLFILYFSFFLFFFFFFLFLFFFLLLLPLFLFLQLNFDVYNALDLMENKTFLDTLKFGAGDGNLQYYLYNWKCPDMPPEKVLVLARLSVFLSV